MIEQESFSAAAFNAEHALMWHTHRIASLHAADLVCDKLFGLFNLDAGGPHGLMSDLPLSVWLRGSEGYG